MKKENLQNQGLIVEDSNKYKNIQVTHHFRGTNTPENAIRIMIMAKLKEKKIIQ